MHLSSHVKGRGKACNSAVQWRKALQLAFGLGQAALCGGQRDGGRFHARLNTLVLEPRGLNLGARRAQLGLHDAHSGVDRLAGRRGCARRGRAATATLAAARLMLGELDDLRGDAGLAQLTRIQRILEELGNLGERLGVSDDLARCNDEEVRIVIVRIQLLQFEDECTSN